LPSALNNLGLTYRRRGDNVRAEATYERALAIRERALGADHLDIAAILINLAALRFYSGDYLGAAAYDRRVLEIREKHLGPDHPDVAIALNNVGEIYISSGEFEKATAVLERALRIREERLGPEHINVAASLSSLVAVHMELGDLQKAKPLLLRAIQIAEKKQASDPIALANFFHLFGELLTLEGNYTQAESILIRELEIRERISGADGHDVGRVCTALAQMYALKGDAAKAIEFQVRSGRIYEKNINVNLAVGTEHQKLSYMKLMSEDLNQAIALSTGLARNNSQARVVAATEIMQRKGRVLDATASSLAALRQRFDPQDRLLFDRLNDANTQLSDLILNRPPRIAPDAYGRQIADLRRKKEGMEKEIGVRSRGYYGDSPAVTLETMRAIIPQDSALIEFAIYRPYVSPGKTADSVFGEPRYIAFVVRKSGEIGSAELGQVRDIDAAVGEFRVALRDPRRNDVAKLARDADRLLMMPVRKLLGGTNHLLISPDGELNLIPFEALVSEKGQHLIESYSISYLTSGRDLARLKIERDSKSKPVIVANPVFGESNIGPAVAAKQQTPNLLSKHRSITSTRNLSDTYFAPLNGTAQEAVSIKALFPESQVLIGPAATEKSVKNLEAPKILHIATHGFFLNKEDPSIGKSAAPLGAVKTGGNKIENPLLRSGLALAGANQRKGGEDDGILTALEASGLNLWGTKLVVLSACDTGVGEVRNGEGVYGLRRSFQLAGAETLVMSMWPVSDYVTRELMTGYYKNLKQGLGRGQSLRQVQLQMLKRPNRRHPFYWASFIQSGEWADLDGKR
jgi:CHAT domain-containing protein